MWRSPCLVLILLAHATFASAQESSPDVVALDRIRVRSHLAEVEAALRATDVSQLTDAQRAARNRRLDDLHGYWVRGEFPHGNARQPAPLSPTFIDEGGRPCAMAWLVIASGHDAVAREIARDQNYAYVPDITHPALRPWLDENGLTLEEAARVQPSYCSSAPDHEQCACLEACWYLDDAGPPACTSGLTYRDVTYYAVPNRCFVDCFDAAVTGPAICNDSFECECTDGGPEDASVRADASTFDANAFDAGNERWTPSGGALCSVGTWPARPGWWVTLFVIALGLRKRRSARKSVRCSTRPSER